MTQSLSERLREIERLHDYATVNEQPLTKTCGEAADALDRQAAEIALLQAGRQLHDELADHLEHVIAQAAAALERCQTVLGNMALENKGTVFNRWPINHEPLRADARGLLPVISEALAALRASAGEEQP